MTPTSPRRDRWHSGKDEGWPPVAADRPPERVGRNLGAAEAPDSSNSPRPAGPGRQQTYVRLPRIESGKSQVRTPGAGPRPPRLARSRQFWLPYKERLPEVAAEIVRTALDGPDHPTSRVYAPCFARSALDKLRSRGDGQTTTRGVVVVGFQTKLQVVRLGRRRRVAPAKVLRASSIAYLGALRHDRDGGWILASGTSNGRPERGASRR
jgi:hypothetical protein